MRAKLWGRMYGTHLYIITSSHTKWTALSTERKEACKFIKRPNNPVEISIREDGKLELRETGKRMKLYPDEATLRVALALRGMEIREG